MLADAEKLVASPQTKMLGNWPLDRLLGHLSVAIERSIDGVSFQMPWYKRLLARYFIKGRVLKQGVPAGFNLPKDREAGAYPSFASPKEALSRLRQAVARSQVEKMASRHPFFGALTHDEWTRFHLRHAEMHLSFAVPG
jgi:hypothetical protein